MRVHGALCAAIGSFCARHRRQLRREGNWLERLPVDDQSAIATWAFPADNALEAEGAD